MEQTHNTKKQLSSFQIVLMAIAAGVSVANIYYNQPILKYISQELHVEESRAGSIAMLSQIGYGIGLFFIVPMGDKVSRKKLVLFLLLLLMLSLVAMYFAPSFILVQMLSIMIGILSVTPQVIIPMAAAINYESRGKTVGTILSGLLIGILSARVLSGFIADRLSWRWVYGISAIMTSFIIVALKFSLPDVKSEFKGNYVKLLKSTVKQLGRFAALRESAFLGAMLFGVFCAFWTTLTFYLSAVPFEFSAEKIGLFGFVAIAGALMAPVVGKLNDMGKTRLALYTAVLLTLISVILFKVFSTSIPIFIVAILLLDIGVQGGQVTNAARIYGLDIDAASRINTIYMTIYFIGGSIGTGIGLWCWHMGKWPMVTNQMLLYCIIALVTVIIGGKMFKQSKRITK